jgi:exopolysaccharide biosynthesis WecB/TagA/CpsF family protein
VLHVDDGFKNDDHYLDRLRDEPAALVILAMGMPRQERCALYLKQHLQYPCLIVCGGAIIDFIGGKVRRAPSVMRTLGLEWAYRLAREPRRMFGRYVTGGMAFVWRLISLRANHYRPSLLGNQAWLSSQSAPASRWVS